ncbi:Benzyl alcohol O-benzoyltransferase [Ananas comosus]|uniref:Benzyl alcohol O-benzoyltransferase n=1 Tax=Ananas comosus TaxID=4615 RepID=A0A199V2C1_ANACO|nr:Benzyl alcohol O-benzoyltransferase [Ananas comosus]
MAAAAAAASSSSLTFAVRRSEPVLVPPAEPTPYELKPLSDIDDQESLRFYRSGIYFFRSSPSKIGQDPVAVVRSAVAKALVHYYPLAGRILEGPGRKLAVECTGEGVVFVGADADVTLEDFGGDLSPPIPCNEKLLCEPESSSADIIGRPLLFIQVTRMKCGGFIFAVQICHCMADAAGLVQLLIDIGELARGADAPSVPPVWARSSSRRSPPRVTHQHPEYEEVADPARDRISPADALVHRRFFFRDEEETACLRRQAPAGLRGTCSRFELIAAFVWKCRTIALRYDAEDEVRIQFVVNARGKRRISKQPQLPRGFYGNAFAFAVASSTAGELCERPFGYALQLVAEAKARVLDVGYLQSVSDLMVLKARPRFAVARTYLVSDLTKSGLRAVDFGWGEGVYCGPATATLATFHIPVEGGIAVPVRLPRPAMERFCIEFQKLVHSSRSSSSSSAESPLGRVDSGLDLGSASGLGPISKL